jgi:hypothetical protein
MDDLAGVPSSIHRSLRPEGSLLPSAVSQEELMPAVPEMAGRFSLVNRKRTELPACNHPAIWRDLGIDK